MSKTGRVWIDLTDISVWQGHHTGIQRVVYQVASRYASDPDTGYFIFDPRTKKFREFSFDSVQQQIEKEAAAPQSTATEYQANKYKVLAYKLYAKSPYWVKDK